MRLPSLAGRRVRWPLLLSAATLFAVVLAGPVAAETGGTQSPPNPTLIAQETTTSSPTSTSQTTNPPTTTSGTSGEAAQPGQTAIVPPIAPEAPLNPGWKTDQMEVRVLPEYDQKAVLVILGFSLPTDVQLPATIKVAIPAGANIAGIGEVDPNGNFKYNYAGSYPPITPGGEWDIATIEVKNYRQLQIDYYYDPGLPEGAGQRSFPILAQVPEDVSTLVVHVQQPTRATNFEVKPALNSSGQAGDGFTYSVAMYSDVKAGSTLGHIISYYKPDGGLSIDSNQSTATQFNTNTVLLAAILAVVVIVGGFVVYRVYSNSRRGKRPNGRPGARQVTRAASSPVGTKRQRQAGKVSTTQGTATRKGEAVRSEPPKAAGKAERASTVDSVPEEEDGTQEYCVACGEELNQDTRFCPSCGEARP